MNGNKYRLNVNKKGWVWNDAFNNIKYSNKNVINGALISKKYTITISIKYVLKQVLNLS